MPVSVAGLALEQPVLCRLFFRRGFLVTPDSFLRRQLRQFIDQIKAMMSALAVMEYDLRKASAAADLLQGMQ
jgi:hypothetical protein